MARGKKKETLIPEERLQAALVPESEQPYKVPANWCWTYLTKGAAECLDSFRKPINASERANREGDIPYYGATGQVGWIDDFLTNEQLVLVGEDGAPFLDLIKDKAYIIEGKAWVNNHAHILRSRFGTVGNLFLMHYLNIFNYHDFVNGTTRLKLTQGSMDIMPVPVPPLSEQQRIVDRIESMFAKLDEAKQKAQDALDSFETRKAAILHKAFTGELTAQWRKEHGVGMESWDRLKLGEIGTLERGRSQHRPRNDPRLFGGPYPFIQTGDVASANVYIMEHHQTLSEFGMEQSRMFSAGTLCITIAANIGDVAILSSALCAVKHFFKKKQADICQPVSLESSPFAFSKKLFHFWLNYNTNPPPATNSPSYSTSDCPGVIALCGSSKTTSNLSSPTIRTVHHAGLCA